MTHHAVLGSERELCTTFIDEFNQQTGWVCYPEIGSFHVLVVHEEGWQIGVDTKTNLADQILPVPWAHPYGSSSPDYRMVIVGSIAEASAGCLKP